jgi:hypothetical protein
MRNLFLATVCLAISAVCCVAQQPIYNQGAGTVTWTISEDTTQAMLGCPGNNYNAEGQCEGTMQWYYHTGNVSLSITNKRTGKTATSAQTVTGGVATASVSLAVQPGDQVSYTETQRVYCPVANVWSGMSGLLGNFEIAYTLTASTGGPRGSCTTINGQLSCAYPVRDWCTASTTPPDNSFNGSHINDFALYAYWSAYAICFRPGSSGPWACSNGIAVGSNAALGFGSCTKNP